MIIKALLWIKAHKSTAGAIAALALLGSLFAYVILSQTRQARYRGWDMLSQAQILALNNRAQEAFKLLNEMEAVYSGNAIGDFALLQKANLLVRGGDYNQAIETYQKVALRQKTNALLPLAKLGTAKAFEAANMLDKAEREYEGFLVSYSDHFSAAEAYEGLARVAEAKGDANKARDNFEKIRVLYPDTIWSKLAETKLKALPGTK